MKNVKNKLRALIKRFDNPCHMTEEESNDLILEIDRLSPDPEISDYIFMKKYEHLTIDEIVEKAFSYKPTILGDQSQKSPND